MRRVVVTGLGMLTPLGCGVEQTWTRLLKGESSAKKIMTFTPNDFRSSILGSAAQVRKATTSFAICCFVAGGFPSGQVT